MLIEMSPPLVPECGVGGRMESAHVWRQAAEPSTARSADAAAQQEAEDEPATAACFTARVCHPHTQGNYTLLSMPPSHTG